MFCPSWPQQMIFQLPYLSFGKPCFDRFDIRLKNGRNILLCHKEEALSQRGQMDLFRNDLLIFCYNKKGSRHGNIIYISRIIVVFSLIKNLRKINFKHWYEHFLISWDRIANLFVDIFSKSNKIFISILLTN